MKLEDIARRYKEGASKYDAELTDRAENGQSPSVWFHRCMDSADSTDTLLGIKPAEAFGHGLAGGFIPKFSEASEMAYAFETAFQVAVGSGTRVFAAVPHTQCGAAKALAATGTNAIDNPFLALATEARDRAAGITGTDDQDAYASEIERQLAVVSLQNFATYPALREGIADGSISIHAFLHDIANKRLLHVDPNTLELNEL